MAYTGYSYAHPVLKQNAHSDNLCNDSPRIYFDFSLMDNNHSGALQKLLAAKLCQNVLVHISCKILDSPDAHTLLYLFA